MRSNSSATLSDLRESKNSRKIEEENKEWFGEVKDAKETILVKLKHPVVYFWLRFCSNNFANTEMLEQVGTYIPNL